MDNIHSRIELEKLFHEKHLENLARRSLLIEQQCESFCTLILATLTARRVKRRSIISKMLAFLRGK